MADAGNDEFLERHLHQRMSTRAYYRSSDESYFCRREIGRRLHPLDSVADLLNGIDERADIARDVV